MRNYSALSDQDFELLVADLLGADDRTRYEAFSRGADQGVDLRRTDSTGTVHVVQCKHMLKSTFPQLLAAAKREAAGLGKLDPQPATYRFVTSQGLTAKRKVKLREALGAYISRDEDLIGEEDLEGFFTRNPNVERGHVKLWLSSGAQLDQRLNAATWTRSLQLKSEIERSLKRFVQGTSYSVARDQLFQERVLIISGPPGIGKSTLGNLLVADAVATGYVPVALSEDVDDGFSVFDDQAKQVFHYDDFLGSTFLELRLAKNEEKRLTAFMRRVAESKDHLFVLTTREHILQQAAAVYEDFNRESLINERFLLEMTTYSRLDRAKILYNHIWHSEMVASAARAQLAHNRAYLRIIDHENYNPRLIEYVTGLASRKLGPAEFGDYVGFVVDVFDHPEEVWRYAFEVQLDRDCRLLLLLLASMPSQVTIEDLRNAYNQLLNAESRTPSKRDFMRLLRILDDSFTKSLEAVDETFIKLANPSLQDFATMWLVASPEEAIQLIDGASFFEQLTWLWQRVRPLMPDQDGVDIDRAIDEALQRCWESGNPSWGMMHWQGENISRLTRNWISVADRLRFAFSFVRTRPPWDPIWAWYSSRLSNAAEGWRKHITNAGSVVGLVSHLRDSGYDIPDHVIASIRDELRTSHHAYGWSQLHVLCQMAPGSFPKKVRDEIRVQCNAWLTRSLQHAAEIADSEELASMIVVAQAWDVVADDALYEEARQELNERPQQSYPGDDGPPTRTSISNLSAADELAAMDALFNRLSGAER